MGMLSVNVSVTAGRWPAASSQSSWQHLAALSLCTSAGGRVLSGQPPIAGCDGVVGFGDEFLRRSDWLAGTVES